MYYRQVHPRFDEELYLDFWTDNPEQDSLCEKIECLFTVLSGLNCEQRIVHMHVEDDTGRDVLFSIAFSDEMNYVSVTNDDFDCVDEGVYVDRELMSGRMTQDKENTITIAGTEFSIKGLFDNRRKGVAEVILCFPEMKKESITCVESVLLLFSRPSIILGSSSDIRQISQVLYNKMDELGFSYGRADDSYFGKKDLYLSVLWTMSPVVVVFSIIMTISAAVFCVYRRKKEIWIRLVHGADNIMVVKSLMSEMLKAVLVSTIVAIVVYKSLLPLFFSTYLAYSDNSHDVLFMILIQFVIWLLIGFVIYGYVRRKKL